MTAIGYVRRSKESTERTVSLEDQRARIAAYCTDRGWSLAEILADDGVSGGNRERLGVRREIVALRGAGLSLRAISGALAARWRLARNGKPFAPMTLSRLVTNRTVRDSLVAG